jgi:serine/threonine-protein kinase HipA
MPMPQTYVYIQLEENPVPVGLLDMTGIGREATARFRYGRRYLQRKDRLAIDPVQLPLPEANSERDYVTGEGFALFNGIRDAAPDGWGRHLMDRAAGGRVLSEFDYLVATGDDRSGALAFGPDLEGPRRVVPWEQKAFKDESPSLSDLLKAIQAFDKDGKIP